MIAYNHAGDSETSLLSSDVTDPNVLPVANAGDDQVYYLYEEGIENVEVILPKNGDGTNNNYSYDPDAFENEDLYKVKDGEFKDWYVMMYYNLIDDSLEEIEVSRKKSELI